MKKSLLILLFSSILLSSCGPTKEDEHKSEDGKEEEKTPEVLTSEYTQKIILSGNDISSVAKATGVQFSSEYTENVSKLTNYCTSKLNYTNLLTQLDCKNLNTCEWNPNVALCIGTGYYGNDKFKSGSLKWNSNEKIYKVVLNARAYTKKNSYSGDIIDTPAKIGFDTDAAAPLLDEGETAANIKTFTKEYAEGVYSFSIVSKDARVAIESIEITWKK